MAPTMKRFEPVAEFLAMAVIVAAGVVLTGWSSLYELVQ